MKQLLGISKSKYCKGMQCPKILWMDRNMSGQHDGSNMDQSKLDTGNQVGELARGYFGNFGLVPYEEEKAKMIEETKRLIDLGTPVIAEASFSSGGNFCSVDILKLNGGSYDIIEVKSSAEVKDIHISELAYQYHVLANSGIPVNKAAILHIDNTYVRNGGLDIHKLFALADCTAEAAQAGKTVEQNIAEIRKIVGQSAEPAVKLGIHCYQPYECGYMDYCWRNVPHPSVFDISGMTLKKKFDLASKGIITFHDVLKKKAPLSAKQLRQVETEVKGLPPRIDKANIKAFLNTLSYPLYFLDFETYQQAIPEFDGVSPYMQIPFQFSVHVLDKQDSDLEHHEFLAQEGSDPRRKLAEALCNAIPRNVCVLAYNMSFEKSVIKKLAAQFPGLADHLMSIHDNIKDLMQPFQAQACYQKEMQGSYSIKNVLPALFPNDPELDYAALEGIHNGGEAMEAFAGLADRQPEEISAIRQSLLNYCRLDTLAMVKICKKLEKLSL